MPLRVTKIDVWSGEIQDRPGGLTDVLRQLAGASANLEMVVARRPLRFRLIYSVIAGSLPFATPFIQQVLKGSGWRPRP